MCGIVALYNARTTIPSSFLKTLTDALIHRGPDAEGYATAQHNHIGLASRRLSLLDLSTRANQPLHIGDSLIVFNGEIYNWKRLREELAPYQIHWQTTSDTEVIVRAINVWGMTKTLSKLNGCFAFALYDGRKKRLYLVRDHLGEKPLFFTRAENGDWIFASEIKAILAHPHVRREPNMEMFLYDLIFGAYTHPTMTHFSHITFLPAGHYMYFDVEKPSATPVTVCYWNLSQFAPARYTKRDLPRLYTQYQTLLRDSVALRMDADVPVGSILSGGLDSSLITALAAPYFVQKYGSNLPCFTTYYEMKRNTDLRYAQLLIHRIPHLTLSPLRLPIHVSSSTLLYLTKQLEQPIYDKIFFGQYQNYQGAATARLKAVLNGQGNDELWLGYYQADALYRRPRTACSIDRFSRYWLTQNPVASLLDTPALQKICKRIIQTHLEKTFLPYAHFPILDALCRFSMHTHLQQVLKEEDKLSMATSVETRLPYLDIRLVQLALSIPGRLKIFDGREKYIPRQSAYGMLPKEIIMRQKRGFPHPPSSYDRHLAQQISTCMHSSQTILQALFQTNQLKQITTALPLRTQWSLLAISCMEQVFFS